jgi:dATP pyrophosphohydrolase
MARAPFQVIVFPFLRMAGGEHQYAIFRRRTHEMWQAISGGGEDAETPAQAAVRETFEEAGIVATHGLVALDSRGSIPKSIFAGSHDWPKELFVVPEHAFGVRVDHDAVRISSEHREVAWLPFQEAHARLTWDSNKVALWELQERLCRGMAFER